LVSPLQNFSRETLVSQAFDVAGAQLGNRHWAQSSSRTVRSPKDRYWIAQGHVREARDLLSPVRVRRESGESPERESGASGTARIPEIRRDSARTK
jgi:hypothetical protein